jgi:hypothetical protein
VQQERTELLAEPERAVAGDPERLDVEVAAGEQAVAAALGLDRERDPAVRVAQRDPVEDRPSPGPFRREPSHGSVPKRAGAPRM